MTLALGACCADGVVIVEDKVIYRPLAMEKDKISYDEKIRGVILNVIFGYSGEVKMYDLFVKYLVGDIVILRDKPEAYTRQNMIEKLCNVMSTLQENYRPFLLTIMTARQFPRNGRSDLHLIKSTGKQESIKQWRCIGEGERIANPLVSDFWNSNNKLHMKDFAQLGYCIIKYIEQRKIEPSVGVGIGRPSIKYMKDAGVLDNEPTDEESNEFENGCAVFTSKFDELSSSE
jgi:20S proteasome alpha/beta subunit